MLWKLNTSNWGKYQEYRHYFAKYNQELEITSVDLKEILSNPLEVIVHKASQMDDQVLVEDTSLDVEGADVGVNVRWLLNHMKEFEGRRATFRVLLAYKSNKKVFVYQGEVQGTLVSQKGNSGFGFDAIFQPDGELETLAEAKPDRVNARAIAIKNLFTGSVYQIAPMMEKWTGDWQGH
jgi:XTP/dITP diphosphohydrolase